MIKNSLQMKKMLFQRSLNRFKIKKMKSMIVKKKEDEKN